MMQRLSFGWLIPLVLVALVSVGCDDSNDAGAVAALGSTTPTTALAATPTRATTTTTPSHKTTSEPEPDATRASIGASDVLVPDSWSPILAETKARPAPPPATCPTFSMPAATDRAASPVFPYKGGSHGPSQVVFDQHAGHVIYHDRERTWVFDVCTNTWTRLSDHDIWKPSGWLGAPVYDIDSDTTVSFGYVRGVFDSETGSWTEHTYPNGLGGIRAAAYDPVSGLIVATSLEDRLLRAYDVDTDTWTEIRIVPTPPEWGDWESVYSLGYLPASDRLVVTTDHSDVTLLVDPRTGVTSVINTPSPGWPVTGGAVWQTADSVIANIARLDFSPCEFNEQTLTWDTCHALPDETTNVDPDAELPSPSTPFEVNTIVEDTINHRLLFLGIRDYRAPHIWAYDQDTDQWTHIPYAIGN